jgi:hypothetical protein
VTYAVYLIKATRKPTQVFSGSLDECVAKADSTYDAGRLFDKARLIPTGVSVQVIHSDDVPLADSLEIGGFGMHKIKVFYQCGSY